MKRIIKNKVYDTKTAKKLVEYEPNPYHSDFRWFCETLYKKKSGEFFLHGEGNAASEYSKGYGNERRGDEKIVPLTYNEARAWAEENLEADEYISIFGEHEEGEGSVSLHISLPSQAAAKIKQQAAKAGMSISGYIALACEVYGEDSPPAQTDKEPTDEKAIYEDENFTYYLKMVKK